MHKEPKSKAGKFPVSSVLGDSVEDVTQASGQSSKSERLSHQKAMLDMKDGDSHFNVGVTSVAPINDMYMMVKTMSIFKGYNANIPIVTDTQINRC